MKKVVLSAFLGLFSAGVFAQTSQGNISVGGNLSYANATNKYTSEESKGSNFNIAPSVGYFVKNGFELGISSRLTFGSTSNQDAGSDEEDKQKHFTLQIGPYLTKYVTLTEKLYFTASGGFGLEKGSLKNPNLDQELVSSTTGFYLSATPGFTYFANPRLGFTLGIGNIGYFKATATNEQASPKTEEKYEGFNLTFNPASVAIGLRYYINR